MITDELRLTIGRNYAESLTNEKYRARVYQYQATEFARQAPEEIVRDLLPKVFLALWLKLDKERQDVFLATLVADNIRIDEMELTHICDEVWGALP